MFFFAKVYWKLFLVIIIIEIGGAFYVRICNGAMFLFFLFVCIEVITSY